MTRSGRAAAAVAAMFGNGQACGSLHSWATRPRMRQPVSPNIRMRCGLGRARGSGLPSSVAATVPGGTAVSHARTGNSAGLTLSTFWAGSERTLICTGAPSNIATGQASSTIARALEVPSGPSWTHWAIMRPCALSGRTKQMTARPARATSRRRRTLGMACSLAKRFVRKRLFADAADLRALERQIVHEPLGIDDEPDDGARNLVGIDRAAGADRDNGDRTIDADLPAIDAAEARQGLGRHEHDDDGARLRADLKAERGRERVVVSGRLAGDPHRAFAIFATEPEARFDNGREYEDGGRLRAQLAGAGNLLVEPLERPRDGGIDLAGARGRARPDGAEQRQRGN